MEIYNWLVPSIRKNKEQYKRNKLGPHIRDNIRKYCDEDKNRID